MTNQSPALPNWTARQVVLATLFVVLVGLGFWLLYRYRMVVLVFFAAMILGIALRPMVDWLVRRGLSRGLSLTLTFVILLGGIIALISAIGSIILKQSLALTVSLPEFYIDLRQFLLDSASLLLQNIGYNLPTDLRTMLRVPPLESGPMDAVTRVTGILGAFSYSLAIILATILFASFWIIEGEWALRSLLLIIPLRKRQQVSEFVELVEDKVGAYVRGQLILCLSIGLLALIAYLVLGLPNALAMAVFAGILEVVPFLGPALGAVPAVLVAFSIEPSLAWWVVGASVIIQGIENNLLVPRVMRTAVGVNPIVTLLSIATLTSLLGLPGALIAVPLAAVIHLAWNRFVVSTDQSNRPSPAGRDMNSALRYEVQELIADVRKRLRKKDDRSDQETDQIEDAIEALAADLDLLLDQDLDQKPVEDIA